MGAFIVAGVVAVITLALSVLIVFAAGMSDNISASRDAGGTALGVLITGGLLAVAVALSHFVHLPHISW